MTSMRRVATAGSVSGSRLVTQNLLLGLDNGWITGLWTARAQRQGVLRPSGEQQRRAEGGSQAAGALSFLQLPRPSSADTPGSPAGPGPWHRSPAGPGPWHRLCRLPGCPSQPPPPTCFPSFSWRVAALGRSARHLGQVGSDRRWLYQVHRPG